MNKYTKFLTVLLTGLMSCAPVLTIRNVNSLDKNMTCEQVIQNLPVNTIDEKVITLDHVEYFLWTYDLSSGESTNRFLLVFKEGKLFFWGYPHEFARSSNPEINTIGKKYLKAGPGLREN